MKDGGIFWPDFLPHAGKQHGNNNFIISCHRMQIYLLSTCDNEPII